MQNINIKNKKEINDGQTWEFKVEVGDEKDKLTYTVFLSRDYWRKLAGNKINPDTLVKRSFDFLLEREPKGSILSEFNLNVIPQYFPEYEEEVKVK